MRLDLCARDWGSAGQRCRPGAAHALHPPCWRGGTDAGRKGAMRRTLVRDSSAASACSAVRTADSTSGFPSAVLRRAGGRMTQRSTCSRVCGRDRRRPGAGPSRPYPTAGARECACAERCGGAPHGTLFAPGPSLPSPTCKRRCSGPSCPGSHPLGSPLRRPKSDQPAPASARGAGGRRGQVATHCRADQARACLRLRKRLRGWRQQEGRGAAAATFRGRSHGPTC